MPQVAEVMTDNVYFLEVTSSVREAIRLMHDIDIRHLPVLDDGELAGIVSDRDLRELEISLWDDADAAARMRQHMNRPVSDFMNANVQTVRPEDDVRDAIDLMLEHRIGAIPVVDPSTQELSGIVSYVDVLRELRDAL